MKTRLYLDVDGVLNAWSSELAWPDASEGRADRFTIKWSPSMVTALNKLDVELVWLTTWRGEAQSIIEPLLGIDFGSRVLHPLSGETTFPSIWWKFEAVKIEQEENPGKFIWFDDELEVQHIRWAERTNGLAVPIDHGLGITPVQIELAKAFLAM